GIGITYNSTSGIRLNTTGLDQTVTIPRRLVDFVNNSGSPLRDELMNRLHTEQLDLFDVNHNGTITVGELETLSGLTAYGSLYTSTVSRESSIAVTTIVTALDTNGNGLLEVSEAVAFLSTANDHLATDADRFTNGVLTDARYYLISRAMDAGATTGAAYAVIEAHGDISINGHVFAAADLRVSAESGTFRIFVGLNINLGPFGNVTAFGSLSVSTDGIAGMLFVDISAGKAGYGLSIGGKIIIQMNTSSADATIDSYAINKQTGTVGSSLVTTTVPANKTLIKLGGYFTFADLYTLRGETQIETDSEVSANCTFKFDNRLTLGNFGSFNVAGDARFENGVFSGFIDLGAQVVTRPLRIEGGFTLLINSGNTSQNFTTAGGSTVTIPRQTYQVKINATMQMYGFGVTGDISLGVVNGHFEIVINNISLNFFGFTATVSGWITDESYSITGTAGFGVNFGPLSMSAALAISISGNYSGQVSASATLRGDVKASVKIAGTRYRRTLADITANVSFSKTSTEVKASASLRVKVLGVVLKGSVNWSMTIATSDVPVPVLYEMSGDTLYLNMGSRASYRIYSAAEVNESFSILTSNPDPNAETDDTQLYITGLGYTSTVSKASVKHIVVPDAGSGDDYLLVDSEINADVTVHAGDGDDVIYAYSQGSSGSGNSVWGGNGDDVLRGGDGNDSIYGDAGNDDIAGGAGSDSLSAGDGNNIVYGDDDLEDLAYSDGTSNNIYSVIESTSDGADTITVGSGQNIIFGGAGNDSISLGQSAAAWNTSRETPVIRKNVAGQTVWLPKLANSEGVPVTSGAQLTVNGATSAGTLFFEDGDWKYQFTQSESNTDTLTLYLTGPAAVSVTLQILTTVADSVVYAGSGTDTINYTGSSSAGSIFVKGDSEVDILKLNGNYSGTTMTAGQKSLAVGSQVLSFDTSLESVELVDTASATTLATASATSMQFDSVNLTVQASGVVNVSNATFNISSGTLKLTSVGLSGVLRTSVQNLEVDNTGTGSAADITVAESNDLHISGIGIQSNGGNISITADSAGGGTIVMDAAVVIDSGSGNVTISAPGSITISSVQTTTGVVSITSASGSILDGGDVYANLIGSTGSSFALRAATGIGTSANPLDTSISTVAFQNSSGDVNITNTGSLTVRSVDGITTSTNTGTTRLVATSPIVFAANTTQATLLAQATESSPTNYDSITVNAGVTVTATSGNLTFEAGDGITIASGAIVQTNAGEIIFRTGLNDTDSNGSMTLNGTIQALAAGQFITLDLNQQQGVTQSSTGALIASNLRLISTGNVAGSFSLGTSTLNDVDTLAANTSGAVTFKDLDSLTIGSISGSSGIAAMAGISTHSGVTDSALVSITTGGNLTVNQAIDTLAGSSSSVGTVTLNSSGSMVLTGFGDITSDGVVQLTASSGIQTDADITTTNDNVTLISATTLTGAVAIDTGSGAGTIAFNNTLNGGQNLTLTAGTGNIDFDAAVGNTARLGILTIVNAINVTADSTVNAASIVQQAGSGTTTFTGAVNTSTAAGVNLTGTNVVVTGGITTTSNGVLTTDLSGSATLANGSVSNIAGTTTIDADGAIVAGGSTTSVGQVLLKSNTDSITINSSASMTSSTQNVTLEAEDSITVSSTALVSTTLGEIIFRSGLDDTDSNGSMTLN
ncbi:MAG: hypothetical protein WCK86_19010, partial [Planctomycetia bacterium]